MNISSLKLKYFLDEVIKKSNVDTKKFNLNFSYTYYINVLKYCIDNNFLYFYKKLKFNNLEIIYKIRKYEINKYDKIVLIELDTYHYNSFNNFLEKNNLSYYYNDNNNIDCSSILYLLFKDLVDIKQDLTKFN